VNSVRVSIALKIADELEEILANKFCRFMMMRAENFIILRRKPVKGYNISMLICNQHTEAFIKVKLIDFIIHFMRDVDSEVSQMKSAVNARARITAQEYLTQFT